MICGLSIIYISVHSYSYYSEGLLTILYVDPCDCANSLVQGN